MKTIQIELPEPMVTQVDALIDEGWFTNQNQIILFALAEFIRRYRFALQEQFQLDDIAWALQQQKAQPV
jgi:Arc/MetJ-type ribon-helix-helix transcriptional regulator